MLLTVEENEVKGCRDKIRMSFRDQYGCWLLFSISVADPLQKLFLNHKCSINFFFFFGEHFLNVIGEICYFLTSSQKAKLKNWQPYYFLKVTKKKKKVIKTASKQGPITTLVSVITTVGLVENWYL